MLRGTLILNNIDCGTYDVRCTDERDALLIPIRSITHAHSNCKMSLCWRKYSP